LLKKYHLIHSVADLKGAPRERKFSNEHFIFIDKAMEANVELTSRQLHGMFTEKFSGLSAL